MKDRHQTMSRVRVDGTKIHFYDPSRLKPYFERDYGEQLLWAKPTGSDVVIACTIRDHCYMERLQLDGSTKWILTYSCDDCVVVADDDTSFSVNGTVFQVISELRAVSIKPDTVFVIVYPNSVIQTRNAYRYNRDGTLKWQIGERHFDPDVPFTSIGWVREGVLKAEGFTESRATGAIVDYDTGEILAREDPR